MNQKGFSSFLAIVILLVICLALGFGFIFYKNYIISEGEKIEVPKVEEVEEEVEESNYSIIDLNDEMKDKLDKKLLEVSDLYRQGDTDAGTIINESFIVSFKDNKYLFSFDYSGGAHCCFSWYIFKVGQELERIDPKTIYGESVLIAEKGNVMPTKDMFLIKDDKLYFKAIDDRFAYDCGAFTSSPFLAKYFLIEDNNILLKNTDFKDEFIQEALNYEDELKKDIFDEEIFCSNLIKMTGNYILAEDNNAWQKFDQYTNGSILSPEKIQSIKSIILERME